MRSRPGALRRIVGVKEQQVRSLEYALARLEQEARRLADDRDSILAALNADEPLHGLFVETMARHLKRVSRRLAAIEAEKDEMRGRILSETGQLKVAERLLTAAELQLYRELERRRLAEAIEIAAAREAASLP